jgi:hypothetical protein
MFAAIFFFLPRFFGMTTGGALKSIWSGNPPSSNGSGETERLEARDEYELSLS